MHRTASRETIEAIADEVSATRMLMSGFLLDVYHAPRCRSELREKLVKMQEGIARALAILDGRE